MAKKTTTKKAAKKTTTRRNKKPAEVTDDLVQEFKRGLFDRFMPTPEMLAESRKKAHEYRDSIETEWGMGLSIGGIVKLEFDAQQHGKSVVFLPVNSARKLMRALQTMSENVPPEDECEETCNGCGGPMCEGACERSEETLRDIVIKAGKGKKRGPKPKATKAAPRKRAVKK